MHKITSHGRSHNVRRMRLIAAVILDPASLQGIKIYNKWNLLTELYLLINERLAFHTYSQLVFIVERVELQVIARYNNKRLLPSLLHDRSELLKRAHGVTKVSKGRKVK
jgi:hypothetical protein